MSKKYEEPQALNAVADFHRTFHLPIEDEPVMPDAQRCALRIALLQEELDELKDAIAQNDLVEAADAFADIQYVLSGAILEFGMADKFKSLFDEAQRSNMSKACKSYEDALATQQYYLDEKATESVIEEKNDVWLVYRKSDRKVLKSINYSPADFETLISDK